MTQGCQLAGVDFSSAPTRRKPITVALGALTGAVVTLSDLLRLESLPAFEAWLAHPGPPGTPVVAGFDFPFGLPRELVQTLGWPTGWADCMRHYASLSRQDISAQFKAFRDARPVGGKFAHRASDGPAGASPSMKDVNPPVAYMLHAGAPRLLDAGWHIPGLHEGDASRVALEAYPGLLARELIGPRSYKSDDKAKQTPERLIARKDLLNALELGQTRLRLRLKTRHALREQLLDDASGDLLDAALCLVQAAWAANIGPAEPSFGLGGHPKPRQRSPGWGLPAGIDPMEGWIITAVPTRVPTSNPK
jgi:hypothetical protein